MEPPQSMGVTWLWYCCCEGIGIGQIGSPIISSAQKFVCLTTQMHCDVTSDFCGGGGLLYDMTKWLCCVHACQCPPSELFVEICGQRLWGARGITLQGGHFGSSPAVLVDYRAEVDAVRREIKEACGAEDYGKALELKEKLDRFCKLAVAVEQREEAHDKDDGEAGGADQEGPLVSAAPALAQLISKDAVCTPPASSAHME